MPDHGARGPVLGEPHRVRILRTSASTLHITIVRLGHLPMMQPPEFAVAELERRAKALGMQGFKAAEPTAIAGERAARLPSLRRRPAAQR